MAYASCEDILKRTGMDSLEPDYVNALLDDAAVIIDAYNSKASDEAKKLVSCNMIIRAVGSNDGSNIPVGATQGSVTALGYSQTWTYGNGSSGELYLSKMDKKLLGVSNKIGVYSPLEGMVVE